MNIFFLDIDPKTSASYHCDKHVVKMIIESAQLLSTAHRELNPDAVDDLYRATHKNHPTAKWVRSSKDHYKWTYELFAHLSMEYTKRYGKTHKSWKNLKRHLYNLPLNIPTEGWVDPPQCMPDHCKKIDTVDAYRNYYMLEKSNIAKWNYSQTPDWFTYG